MKVERFAGDNQVFQQFAQQMAVNDTLMARRQSEALQLSLIHISEPTRPY